MKIKTKIIMPFMSWMFTLPVTVNNDLLITSRNHGCNAVIVIIRNNDLENLILNLFLLESHSLE